MSSLRTIFGIVVLAAILYAVYVSITKPKNTAPPPEVANGLAPPPQGDLLMQATPQFSSNPSSIGTIPAQGPMASSATSGTAFPAVGASQANAAGAPPWNGGGSGGNSAPAMPNSATSFAPSSPLPAAPGYSPAAAPTTPGNPLGNSLLSPAQTPSAPTSNSTTSSVSPYPSTNLPEVGAIGVVPATSIDMAGKPSANINPTRLPDPGDSSAPTTSSHPEFAALLQTVYANLAQGHFAESHAVLSRFYAEPHLTAAESQTLTQLLDQLAGTVIYSRQHLLEPSYKVQGDDTMERIARTYDVSPSLLSKINGIRDPRQLQPGMELKVLHGPFDAVVDLGRYELTLFLKDRYAGRFTVGVGRDHPQLEGQYTVHDKQYSPVYYGPDRRVIAPSDPSYPLGKRWIDLGSQIGIHGTNDPRNIGRTEGRGSIYLSDRDIDDVYDLLTIGSKVTIRR